MNRDEIEGLIADLSSANHPQPIDPKATYRTRAVSLFTEAAAALRAQQARIVALEAKHGQLARDYNELRAMLSARPADHNADAGNMVPALSTESGCHRISVHYDFRPDGGLFVSSDDMPGLIASGADAEAIAALVWPIMKTLAWHKALKIGEPHPTPPTETER